jgi:hypothetical protein
MSERTLRCPRCGTELRYDLAMGLFFCPQPECGTVVRVESSGDEAGLGGRAERPQAPGTESTAAEAEEEWRPEPRGRGWRFVVALVAMATVSAVAVMGLTPLLWPKYPALSVTPGELSFVDQSGAGVMPQALAIQNHGKGQLEWQASTDAAWLSVEPLSGSLESGLHILTVRADTLALAEGTHSATISVEAAGATNSPQFIAVKVELAAPPEARAIRAMLGDEVEVYYDTSPPYVSGPIGVAIDLVQNEASADVTWDQLSEFLEDDATDESPYIQDLYMCGSFSEQLHNNAEAAGIRAAWVSLDIRDRSIGHALNAFFTTDRGLVFVDCTGGDIAALPLGMSGEPCDHDRVAYVRPGMEYGLISLDRAESPTYEFYVAYSTGWLAYVSALEEYNRLVSEYNSLVGGRTLIAGSADARRAAQMHSDLQARRVALEMQREVLGDCRWKSLGVVETVRIYW